MGKSHLSNALEIADYKVRYDTYVKEVLSDKQVLAWIMKYSVSEFGEYSIQEIMDAIEGNPEVAEVPIYPGKQKPESITGISTESRIPNEGEATFDIRFFAITPGQERIKLIINVEAQKKYHVGYDLVTRGIFYCARMLSSQMDREFTAETYGDIKKVYSIWICMDNPKYAENTITEYHIKPRNLYGNFSHPVRYDLLSVVMICLGENEADEKNDFLMVLSTILSETLSPKEKEIILSQKYDFELSDKGKEGLWHMCNLSDLIEEQGIEKGIEQGMKKNALETARKSAENGIPFETAKKIIPLLSEEELREIYNSVN